MNKDDGRSDDAHAEQAADLIRQKIAALYAEEPSVKKEIKEVRSLDDNHSHISKHQKFIRELGESGKSPEQIQTAWHHYYTSLPDDQKHAVWQEYNALQKQTRPPETPKANIQIHPQQQSAPRQPSYHSPVQPEQRSVAAIKKQVIGKVKTRSKPKRSSHVRSLLFGLGMGAVVVIILMFSFFNERIIAPFITPSRTVSNTPIITNPNDTSVGPDPKIIIPKINVEIPVVYDEPSVAENAIQKALERGVVHYANTPEPGQTGNSVIFGHSSNNILNPGKYKFAFVLLSRLEPGDTFMLEKDGKRYVYKVYEKKIVQPTDLSVLTPNSKPSTVTLITCDPPGTSLHRLVVTAEQISPDPNSNIAVQPSQQTAATAKQLPGDAPSLWHRLTSWLGG